MWCIENRDLSRGLPVCWPQPQLYWSLTRVSAVNSCRSGHPCHEEPSKEKSSTALLLIYPQGLNGNWWQRDLDPVHGHWKYNFPIIGLRDVSGYRAWIGECLWWFCSAAQGGYVHLCSARLRTAQSTPSLRHPEGPFDHLTSNTDHRISSSHPCIKPNYLCLATASLPKERPGLIWS